MTYIPKHKLPKWKEVLSALLSYLFMASAYSIVVIGVSNISGILEFNELYYIIAIALMFISLYGIVSIPIEIDTDW